MKLDNHAFPLPVPMRITLATGLLLMTFDAWLPYLHSAARYLEETYATATFMLLLIFTP